MEIKIIVKQLGGGEIGVISQNPGGLLIIQAYLPTLQAELEATVRTVSQQPLTYIAGATEIVGGQTVQKTIQKLAKPGDAEYLPALADALSKTKIRISGKRVRGYVVQS
jgi:hypothetical protein